MDRGVSIAISKFGMAYRAMYSPPSAVTSVLDRIRDCRTESMGGRIATCPQCGSIRIEYNSCRDRHCPNCQGYRRDAWIHDRREELLPVTYFHVVFTLPSALDRVVIENKRHAYASLFRAAWDTVNAFASGAGIKAGMTAVLHTWGSSLTFHPHLHCIVPGGGADLNDGRWRNLPVVSSDNGRSPFLFPVRAMSEMFRAKYMAELSEAVEISQSVRSRCFENAWTVYTRPSATGEDSVLEYLARYAYRVAISNARISGVTDDTVSFTYKDYADGGKVKEMTLGGVEFVRRYAQHILPAHFVRIRHFGFLAPGNRDLLIRLQRECGMTPVRKHRRRVTPAALYGESGWWHWNDCSECGAHNVLVFLPIEPRGRAPSHADKQSA